MYAVVRTFAPFVAGIGKMSRSDGIRDVGNIVKKNFEFVILAVIGVSILPIIFETIRSKTSRSTAA